MSSEIVLNRTNIDAWINFALTDPEKLHNIECCLELGQNIFPFDDFKVDPLFKAPVYKPRQSCVIHVTPLSAAAYVGNEKAVRSLIKFPDPHEHPENVWISPLSLACLSGHYGVVDILMKANAERDENGNPLDIMHVAARKGLEQYIRYHHERYGTEPDIKDMDGITPAVHALYLDDDKQVMEIFLALLELDENALDIGSVWENKWTCTNLARAMGRSKPLLDWLENKCGNSSIEGHL